jgi:hypothetical protein
MESVRLSFSLRAGSRLRELFLWHAVDADTPRTICGLEVPISQRGECGIRRSPNRDAAIALGDPHSHETRRQITAPKLLAAPPESGWRLQAISTQRAHQHHGPQDQTRQLATVYIRFSTNVACTDLRARAFGPERSQCSRMNSA